MLLLPFRIRSRFAHAIQEAEVWRLLDRLESAFSMVKLSTEDVNESDQTEFSTAVAMNVLMLNFFECSEKFFSEPVNILSWTRTG